ncbi:MAG: hypothetical protein GY737_00355 [Desulfobacteraceae bacterium]|nr:hypothetical protein [Desulfobacteraceae bacterium]
MLELDDPEARYSQFILKWLREFSAQLDQLLPLPEDSGNAIPKGNAYMELSALKQCEPEETTTPSA